MSRDWNDTRIIFVCSGNICRSPMAAELTRMMMQEKGFSPRIISMGTIGIVGRSAAENAVEAMREVGGDISEHRSQALNATMLNVADFAFGMTEYHVTAIEQSGPGAFRAARLLADFAPEPIEEIEDPVGEDLDAFRASRDLMRACLERWFEEEDAG